jgi:hypothetical protein
VRILHRLDQQLSLVPTRAQARPEHHYDSEHWITPLCDVRSLGFSLDSLEQPGDERLAFEVGRGLVRGPDRLNDLVGQELATGFTHQPREPDPYPEIDHTKAAVDATPGVG